jgi:hypothetical protein
MDPREPTSVPKARGSTIPALKVKGLKKISGEKRTALKVL